MMNARKAHAPRNWRNNNPLNIKKTSDNWVGADGDDGTFVIYKSPEYGFRAGVKILRSYMSRGITTLEDIIKTWAPHFENDTGAYINYVAKQMKMEPYEVVEPDEFPELMFYMSHFEGGTGQYAFTYDQALAGAKLA